MAKRKGIPGVSFSAKRALGITKAKQKLARKTGVPTSRAGMQRKIGKAATGGGCLLPALSLIAVFIGCIALALVIIL